MKFSKIKNKFWICAMLAALVGLYLVYFEEEDTITYITEEVRRQNVERW